MNQNSKKRSVGEELEAGAVRFYGGPDRLTRPCVMYPVCTTIEDSEELRRILRLERAKVYSTLTIARLLVLRSLVVSFFRWHFGAIAHVGRP
jgi:hypothetical protein